MSSYATLSGSTSFLLDNSSLHKKSFLLDNHFHKDPAQILPSITPSRNNIDSSSHPSPTVTTRRPSMPPSRNTKVLKSPNHSFASPLKRRCQNTKLQPILNHPLLPRESFSLIDEPSLLTTDDSHVKTKRSGSNTRNNSKDSMSPQQTIEKTKDIIKGLESPLDIYLRVVSQKSDNASAGEQTPSKIGMKKLKAIVQKLDLTMDVSNAGRDLAKLNDMKKLPVEYYQKARMSRRREKTVETPKEKPQETMEQKSECEDSEEVFKGFFKIPSYDEEEEFTQRTNASKSAADVFEKNDATPAKNAGIKPWAICRAGPVLYNRGGSMCSSKNLSMTSDRSEKANERGRSGRVKQENRFTVMKGKAEADLKEVETKNQMTQRVMDLAKEIIALKSKTNDDLGTLKSYQRKFLKDYDKIKENSSGISEDQMKIDREHLEDVLVQIKKRSTSISNQVVKNFAKEGVQLKNKQERLVDNIRFERHMAKVDKKIEEKFRNKASSVNLRKRRFVSDNSCRDL